MTQVSAADRKSVQSAAKLARQAAERRASVTREIMSTTQGREWMWDLLASCSVFGNTFYPDSHQSAFAQGERNAGLRLLADIMLNCPDQFIQAQREANERSSIDDIRARSAASGQRRGSTEPDGRDSGLDDAAGDGYYVNDDGDWNDYNRQADRAEERNRH